MTWIQDHLSLTISLVLLGLGIWQLAPKGRPTPRWLGLLLVLGGLGMQAYALRDVSDSVVEQGLFLLFAGAALLCAVLMVTSRNPVYGALWFALVTLSVCGLFLLQGAQFLAAATVIVYAGAIIVTFLFVIMLAQQGGVSAFDSTSRQPFLAAVSAIVMLGALLTTLDQVRTRWEAHPPRPPAIAVNELSRPAGDEPLGSLRGLGRSLFGDYLFEVEVAGTLLMIAAIGAIAIAPKRGQGAL